MTYNGWTNWETWNVVLWCDNEYHVYQDRFRNHNAWTADSVRAMVTEYFPNGTPDFQELPWDAERGAVNWAEIAQHWQTEADEEAA